MPETEQSNTSEIIMEIKTKAKAAWATGSYGRVGAFVPPAAAHLVRVANVQPGQRVLDVATGTGVTAITARQNGADVTALDLTPELIQVAKEEAVIAGTDGIEWREGDAEALPYRDGEFEVVLSSFGHMFAPQPEVVVAEMLRVLKPGGSIAFVTHKGDNVVQRFFTAMTRHVPPPANAPPSPFLWGDPQVIRERLGSGVGDVHIEEGTLDFPMLSPAHFWQLFSTTYGPTMKAIAAIRNDPAKVEQLAHDFIDAVHPFWNDGKVAMDYLVTRAVKKA